MTTEERTYRMYFFVLDGLSPIQQGIQAGHAALEYASKYGDTEIYKKFLFWDKTWIILNGGNSNDGHLGFQKGSMNIIYELLSDKGIQHATFHEQDFNNALTAICFLADDRVWNWEKYPMFNDFINMQFYSNGKYYNYTDHKDWLEIIGGPKNECLKELIYNKKLA